MHHRTVAIAAEFRDGFQWNLLSSVSNNSTAGRCRAVVLWAPRLTAIVGLQNRTKITDCPTVCIIDECHSMQGRMTARCEALPCLATVVGMRAQPFRDCRQSILLTMNRNRVPIDGISRLGRQDFNTFPILATVVGAQNQAMVAHGPASPLGRKFKIVQVPSALLSETGAKSPLRILATHPVGPTTSPVCWLIKSPPPQADRGPTATVRQLRPLSSDAKTPMGSAPEPRPHASHAQHQRISPAPTLVAGRAVVARFPRHRSFAAPPLGLSRDRAVSSTDGPTILAVRRSTRRRSNFNTRFLTNPLLPPSIVCQIAPCSPTAQPNSRSTNITSWSVASLSCFE